MDDHEFPVRLRRNEMVREALEAGREVDPELVHAAEVRQLPHRALNARPHCLGEATTRKPVRPP